MALENLTPVTDSSLLPFGQSMVPRGDDNVSPAYDLSTIFENGPTLGDTTYRGLTVSTNGHLRLGGQAWGITPSLTPVGSMGRRRISTRSCCRCGWWTAGSGLPIWPATRSRSRPRHCAGW